MAVNRPYMEGRYRVTLDADHHGEVIDVELTLRDTLAFERATKRSPLAALASGGDMIHATTIVQICWLAARRLGLTDLSPMPVWERAVADVQVVDDDDDAAEWDDADIGGISLPDPTPSAPTGG